MIHFDAIGIEDWRTSKLMALTSTAPDARLDATLDLLGRLIGFDTESSKSNLGLIAVVEAYLHSLGVAYVKIPNADRRQGRAFRDHRSQLVMEACVLSGHTDVVPVAGQAWTSDPFRLRREAGRVYGRGACDMKGFDAICLAMIPEFQRREPLPSDPYSAQLRRGDDLPRPARHDRAVRRSVCRAPPPSSSASRP